MRPIPELKLVRRPDPVSWLAAGALVFLLGLFLTPVAAKWLGRPLPRDLAAVLGKAIWWTYWGSVVLFGLLVIARWRNTYFRWRTVAAMVAQTIFGLLLIGPVGNALGVPAFWRRLHLTWPLHMSVLTPDLANSNLSSFIYGVIMSLAVWPALAYLLGMRYCSWFCFCGNLAETVGDSFRTLGPKGPERQGLDHTGYGILALAALVTVAVWVGLTGPNTWYGWVVGFFLADIIGIGGYFIWGSRVWCRFFCPLRAVLGWFSRRGRFAIYTDDQRCIECGTCNRYCEMGIEIRERARAGVPLRDTECVACGACIAVCPRYALSFRPFPGGEEARAATARWSLRRPYRRELATPRER